MVISMTGFGLGEAVTAHRRITVEIRCVNSRFLELSVRLPASLQPFELEVRELVRKTIARGKLTLSATDTLPDGSQSPLQLNLAEAGNIARMLRDLNRAAVLDQPITLQDVLSFRDWLVTNEGGEGNENTRRLLLNAVEGALKALAQMRSDEGLVIRNEMSDILHGIDFQVNEVATLAKENSAYQRQRLEQRLTEIGLAPNLIDPARLTAEVALLVERQDINEELTRLRSHLVLFRNSMDEESASGKRLNFLTQEMHREANTIAAKAGVVLIIHHSVRIRELIEQLREQVQNVE